MLEVAELHRHDWRRLGVLGQWASTRPAHATKGRSNSNETAVNSAPIAPAQLKERREVALPRHLAVFVSGPFFGARSARRAVRCNAVVETDMGSGARLTAATRCPSPPSSTASGL